MGQQQVAKQLGDGELLVTVFEAKNLGEKKKGTCNPFCTLQLKEFNGQTFKTKIIKGSTSPQWTGAEFKFFIAQPKGELQIKIASKSGLNQKKIGVCNVSLKGLENGNPKEDWFKIITKKNENAQIRIKLHFPVEKTADEKTEKKTGDDKRKCPEVYDFGEELGRGGFSVVRKAVHKQSKGVFAVKIIEKNPESAEELQLLQREIDIMRKLRHKNIIQLEEVYDDETHIYLVLELVTGGELFDQIVSRGTYSEADTVGVVAQILEAIEYMHQNGIAHRDLKPENLLCSGSNNEVIKVTDFGLSKDFSGADKLKTSCGTPDYVAPEVLRGLPYDHSVDIWSIGVITYILLCGFPPFYGNNDQQIFEKILKAEYDFPSPDWETISAEAKEFIKAILVLDASKRPTATECLQSPWFQSHPPAQSLLRLESFRSGLKEHTEKRRKAMQ